MVWNVPKEEITIRIAYVNPEAWPPPASGKPELPDPNRRINKELGLNEKP